MNKGKIGLVSIFFLLIPLVAWAAQDAGERINRRGVVNDDYYIGGGTIDVSAEVKGDVIAAGGTVSIGRNISGDVMMAGGTLNLRGRVADDVRMAGGEMTIEANVGDDLMAAGGRIEITNQARVGGDAFVAGGDVSIDGNVNGNLFAAGGRVYLSGNVKGDVTIEGDDIEIAKGTRIGGDLSYKSPQKAKISPEATIGGKINYTQGEAYRPHRAARLASVITLSVAGIVLMLVFPGFTANSSGRMSGDFWKHLGLGFALLVATPIAAIVMMASFVGIWVGLPLLFIYIISLLVAYLVGAFFVADRLSGWVHFDVSTRTRKSVALVVTILLLVLLGYIPVLGGLLVFVLMLTALGAQTLQLYETYRGSAKPARASAGRGRRRSK